MAVEKSDIKIALVTGLVIGVASLVLRVWNRKLTRKA